VTHDQVHAGWLSTGDLGYLAGGELYVCGRLKDLIIANGRKIHPQDLEWGVDELPGVRRGRTVALGVPHGDGRDRLVMIVEPSGTVDAEQLASDVRRRLADLYGLFMDEVVIAPGGAVGRTSSGKVQRALTRAKYERGEFGRRPADSGPGPITLQ
jgi:acyl-CoA synthetase (AMP-forming)/AMP-acid ligase II